jgi:hypothetical protein
VSLVSFAQNNDNYADILSTIDKLCSDERKLTGEFQMDSYYVRYDCDQKSETLTIKIYTLAEARANGFIN